MNESINEKIANMTPNPNAIVNPEKCVYNHGDKSLLNDDPSLEIVKVSPIANASSCPWNHLTTIVLFAAHKASVPTPIIAVPISIVLKESWLAPNVVIACPTQIRKANKNSPIRTPSLSIRYPPMIGTMIFGSAGTVNRRLNFVELISKSFIMGV